MICVLLAPLRLGLRLADTALTALLGPDLPPTPVDVLDAVGPWADVLDAL